MLSKAFSGSKVIITTSSNGCCFAYSRAARTFLRLEEADLPLVNSDCAWWIRDGMIFASREATILERILESTFS